MYPSTLGIGSPASCHRATISNCWTNSFVTLQRPACPLCTLKMQSTGTPPLLVLHSQGHRPHQCLVPSTDRITENSEGKALYPQYELQHAKGVKKQNKTKKTCLFVAIHWSFVPQAVVTVLLHFLKAALLHFLKASVESSKVRWQDYRRDEL